MENLLFQEKKLKIKRYTSLVLFSLLLTPAIGTTPNLPSIRLDDIFLLFFPFWSMIFLDKIVVDTRLLIVFFIGLSLELGIFCGAILGFPTSFADNFALIRVLKYGGGVLLASTLLHYEKNIKENFYWFFNILLFLGWILLFFTFQQYFNPFNLNSLYIEYISSTQIEPLLTDHPKPRPIGFVGNPNKHGFIMGFLSLSAFSLFIFAVGKNKFYLLSSIGFFLAMLLTQSRSAIIGFTIALIFLLIGAFFWSFWRRKGKWSILKRIFIVIFIFGGLGLAFGTIFYELLYNYLFYRIDPQKFSKLANRFPSWEKNIHLWLESPVFGIGTLNHSFMMNYADDGEYFKLLKTGGVVQLILVLGLLFFRKRKEKNRIMEKNMHFSLIVFILLYMVPNGVFSNIVVTPLVLMVLVLLSPSNFVKIELSSIWFQKKGVSPLPGSRYTNSWDEFP